MCTSKKNKNIEEKKESSEIETTSEQNNTLSIEKVDIKQPDTKEPTYLKFIRAIEYALLPRFKEWIHLSFYEFGRRLGKEIKGYYRIGSREENYIFIQDDSGQYKKIYSDELQDYIGNAVTSSLFNTETNGIVVYVLRECSTFNPDDVQRYLNYFEDPKKDQTQQIMEGIVSLHN